jgi:hypothetical protein
MQKRRIIRIEYGAHIKLDSVQGWQTGFAYCGDVTHGENERTFYVETRREALFERLKEIVSRHEKEGVIKWREVTGPDTD